MLAILPSLRDSNPGGIQAAGEIAWQALRENFDAHLFEVSAGNRLSAVMAARKVHFAGDVVLFWHLDLLQLAPFLNSSGRRVVFLHGIEAWRRPKLLTRRALRGAAILANSNHTIARARAFIPMTEQLESRVVHLGIGAPDLTPNAPSSTPAAVMIGRLDSNERYKGHDEVIAAWPRVMQSSPNAQLWIVGDGNLRADLEATAAELGLNDAIRFFGRVSEAEKETLIRAARCMVLPSRGEGFGLVYLEAMRVGRPCIVGTDAGREVIHPPEAGRAVDPGNPNALASAIVSMLTPGEEWERTSNSARRRYEANFTAALFQERLVNAIRQMAP